MQNEHDHQASAPIDPTEPRAPRGWTRVATGLITLMALYGLYRGFSSVEGAHTPLLGAAGLGVTAPASTAPATPMPANGDWSTLSGPRILPSSAPKAAVASAAPDDGDDDSGAPDDDAAATDEAPPPTQPPEPKAPTDSASQSQPSAMAPF